MLCIVVTKSFMRPSISDVAKHAGVSTATVSRVLNGSNAIRPHTRDKVQQAIDELGYTLPENNNAPKLFGNKLVMVLVPNIDNPFYSGIVKGIESTAKENGYAVILTNTQGESSLEKHYLDLLKQKQVSGVISLTPMMTQQTLPDEIQKLPWISCSEYNPESPVPYVSINHKQAAKDAVLYLVSKGHERVALVTSDSNYLYAQQREEGYRSALQDAGIPINEDYIQAMGDIDFPLGELAARRLLTQPEPPTAIFAVADMLAIGVMKAVYQMGKEIPKDIAVIGFDDLPLASMFIPSLTTIRQPTLDMGKTAMKMLMKKMAGEDVTSQIIHHTLMVRSSAK